MCIYSHTHKHYTVSQRVELIALSDVRVAVPLFVLHLCFDRSVCAPLVGRLPVIREPSQHTEEEDYRTETVIDQLNIHKYTQDTRADRTDPQIHPPWPD